MVASTRVACREAAQLSMCISRLFTECLLHKTQDGLEQMQAFHGAKGWFATRNDAVAFSALYKRFLLQWQRMSDSHRPVSDLQA